MSGNVRRAIIVIAASALLLGAYQAAFAQVTVTYLGETPSTGSAWYAGTNASSLWDYVYTISPTLAGSGPFYFAVYSYYPVASVYNDEGNGWVGQWYASMPIPSGPMVGQPGVMWDWQGGLLNTPATGTFHFSSQYQPAWLPWSARAIQDTGYSGDGMNWSATPEPASMALTGLCLFGVAAWKRRRMGLKKG